MRSKPGRSGRVCDQGTGGRRLCPHAKAPGADLRGRGRLRGPVRAQRTGSARPRRSLLARRRHPRYPHAADGRAGLPRPHHGRASLPRGHGVIAHGGRRRCDLRGPATGRGRLRRQARGRHLASHRRAAGRAGRQGARRGRRPHQVERPAEGSRAAPDRGGRRGGSDGLAARGPRRMRRPVPPAKAWCWWERRPAGRRRWKPC